MSSGAQSYIAIHPADPLAPNTVPDAAGTGERVNFTSDSFDAGVKTQKSKHVRPDRMLSGLTPVDKDLKGGFGNEFHFEADIGDKILAAAVWGAWQDLVVGTPGDVDISGASITLATVTLDLTGAATIPDNIKAGVTVEVKGSASNDGRYRLMPVDGAPNTYTMSPPPQADETLGAGVVLHGQWLKNSDVYSPFFIERGHVDVDQYFWYQGMGVDTWSLTVPESGMLTSKLSMVGFDTQIKQAPRFDTYTPETENPAFAGVKNIRINGIELPACQMQKFTIDVKNNLKGKKGAAVFGNCGTTAHQFEVGGKLTMYFADEVNYNRLINGTEFAYGFDVVDSLHNVYTFDMMRCKMGSDKINVTSVDADVFDNASFVSLADNATGSAIIISRFKAA